MPNRRVPQSLVPVTSAMLVVCVLVPPTAMAQRVANRELNPPNAYAITNARIVTGRPGPTIERGTVVIRNGVIAAVGANVQAPADARVIDGTGLTVYPGVIDANTSLGLATGGGAAVVADAGRGGRGGGGGVPRRHNRARPSARRTRSTRSGFSPSSPSSIWSTRTRKRSRARRAPASPPRSPRRRLESSAECRR